MSRRGFGTGLLKGLNQGYQRFDENQRQRRTSALDELVKRAELQELGYDVQETPGLFGGKMNLEKTEPRQVPEGFVRVGNKIMSDPSYLNPLQKAQMNLANVRGGQNMLTPGRALAKDKATKEIFEKIEMNKANLTTLDKALEGRETIPQGLFGRIKIGVSKKFPSTKGFLRINDDQIKNAQEMKMALTMGTLAETAHTKGAISDKEMELFKEAADNNDFNSPALVPVLEKIRRTIDAENKGLFGAYRQNYGEDPSEWFGAEEEAQTPEFNSEEEAEMYAQENGFVGGEEIIINGVPMRYQP